MNQFARLELGDCAFVPQLHSSPSPKLTVAFMSRSPKLLPDPKELPAGESGHPDETGTLEEDDSSVFIVGCSSDDKCSFPVDSPSSFFIKHTLQQNPSLNFSATSSSSFSPIHLECIQVPHTSHASMRSPSSSVALINSTVDVTRTTAAWCKTQQCAELCCDPNLVTRTHNCTAQSPPQAGPYLCPNLPIRPGRA